MNAPPLLEARGLSRHYGARCAVSDLDLRLARGEVLGLLGPNGAGKSTTMRMLTGCLAPTCGRVLVNGIDLIDDPRRAKRCIGFLPEQPPLYRDCTVDEYLRLAARLHGVGPDRVARAVESARSACGLGDVGRRLIGNLSRGYQQRVGIAQAIVHAPSVIVLDEPTAGLDPIQIGEIRALIRDLGREHGVLLSTHILSEVEALCTRVQIIHEGRTVFMDDLDGIGARHASPVLIAGFGAPPPEDALRALDGVQGVEGFGAGRYRIVHRGEPGFSARLAEAAASGGWRLDELTPERPSLERIFTDLVYRERHAEAAA